MRHEKSDLRSVRANLWHDRADLGPEKARRAKENEQMNGWTN